MLGRLSELKGQIQQWYKEHAERKNEEVFAACESRQRGNEAAFAAHETEQLGNEAAYKPPSHD